MIHQKKHYYQPAWTLVGGGVFDIKKTAKNEADVVPKAAESIKVAVNEFLPDENTLICKSGVKLTYNYLIVAPSIQLD
ncbi:MAG: hypothetical protein KKG25_01760 [Bacteroidetes bacterium]|nr:hypothetical protein [Bacteroidota bacterium]MBU1483569.1 hypothetical protein [Bacteroidota bacterium]MBU2267972.1 hypothetical protein [Bacteroidota bacterium]MBU2375892.1 hypothetical protein [Bacteroidota bacterium]